LEQSGVCSPVHAMTCQGTSTHSKSSPCGVEGSASLASHTLFTSESLNSSSSCTSGNSVVLTRIKPRYASSFQEAVLMDAMSSESINKWSSDESLLDDLQFDEPEDRSKPDIIETLPEQSSNTMEVPSVGSLLHASGKCTPCIFFTRESGCQKGECCKFCHIRHQRKHRDRPCKERRDRFYRRVEQIHNEIEERPAEISGDPDWVTKLINRLPGFIHNHPDLKAHIFQGFITHAENLLSGNATDPGQVWLRPKCLMM